MKNRGNGNYFAKCLRRPGGSFRENRPLDPCKSFCLIKSFSGGPGGRFFKKAPLVAEGKITKNHQDASDAWYSEGNW